MIKRTVAMLTTRTNEEIIKLQLHIYINIKHELSNIVWSMKVSQLQF